MIYVTGATGFIGGQVARQLLERGERLRCLVRSKKRAQQLADLGAELIHGHVTDSQVHERAMQGVDAAIHLAGIYDIGVVDENDLQRTNVDGTSAFLSAAKAAKVPRLVYVSSNVALGPSADETAEPRDAYNGPYPSVYHRTKADSHRLARAAQSGGAPLIIICPSFVYGPRDEGPAGRFVLDLIERKVPALLSDPAWFSYVFVDDVASGIVAALDRGKIGEVYVLTGQGANMNDFANRVCGLAGVKAPRLRFPVPLAKGLSVVFDAVARRTGLRFPITGEAVRTTSHDKWLHAHERATRDFGYAPRSIEKGLQETVAWFSTSVGD